MVMPLGRLLQWRS